VFNAVALQGADVLAIAELREPVLQDPPIALAGSAAIDLLDMILQVLLDSVIVEQRVVYIDEKDDRITARLHSGGLQIRRLRINKSVSRGAEARCCKCSQPTKRGELIPANPGKSLQAIASSELVLQLIFMRQAVEA
jgi:hypothetical protein